MSFAKFRATNIITAVVLFGTVPGAFAQTTTSQTGKAPPPKPAQSTPAAAPKPAAAPTPINDVVREETKKINNWVVRCQYGQSAKLNCAAAMIVIDDKTKQPVIEFKIIKSAAGQLAGELSLRSGAFIEPGVSVSTDNGFSQKAKFIVCRPNMCVAEFSIDENFKKLAPTSKSMSISFVRGDQKSVSTQFGLDGLDKVLSEIM